MSKAGKRRFPSVIEAAIAAKPTIKQVTAKTFRGDAAAILESLLAEFDEQVVLNALSHQGFDAEAYRSTLRGLIAVAQPRRQERLAGSRSQQDG